MNEAERLGESSKWLQYAREDLRAAQSGLIHPDFAPRHSCYDAQQAAEKAIKAALIFLGIDFLYRHDLEYLNSLLPSDWRIEEGEIDLEQLTDWSVMSRYPGDSASPTEEDAREAVAQAAALLALVTLKFELSQK